MNYPNLKPNQVNLINKQPLKTNYTNLKPIRSKSTVPQKLQTPIIEIDTSIFESQLIVEDVVKKRKQNLQLETTFVESYFSEDIDLSQPVNLQLSDLYRQLSIMAVMDFDPLLHDYDENNQLIKQPIEKLVLKFDSQKYSVSDCDMMLMAMSDMIKQLQELSEPCLPPIIKVFQKIYQYFKSKMGEQPQMIIQLTNLCQQLDVKLIQTEQQRSELQEQFNDKIQIIQELDKNTNKLEQQVKRLQQSHGHYEIQINDLEILKASHLQQIKTLEQMLQKNELRNNDMRFRLNKIQLTFKSQRQSNSILTNKLADVERQYIQKTDQVSSLMMEYRDLQQRFDDNDRRLQNTRDDLSDLYKKYQDLYKLNSKNEANYIQIQNTQLQNGQVMSIPVTETSALVDFLSSHFTQFEATRFVMSELIELDDHKLQEKRLNRDILNVVAKNLDKFLYLYNKENLLIGESGIQNIREIQLFLEFAQQKMIQPDVREKNHSSQKSLKLQQQQDQNSFTKKPKPTQQSLVEKSKVFANIIDQARSNLPDIQNPSTDEDSDSKSPQVETHLSAVHQMIYDNVKYQNNELQTVDLVKDSASNTDFALITEQKVTYQPCVVQKIIGHKNPSVCLQTEYVGWEKSISISPNSVDQSVQTMVCAEPNLARPILAAETSVKQPVEPQLAYQKSKLDHDFQRDLHICLYQLTEIRQCLQNLKYSCLQSESIEFSLPAGAEQNGSAGADNTFQMCDAGNGTEEHMTLSAANSTFQDAEMQTSIEVQKEQGQNIERQNKSDCSAQPDSAVTSKSASKKNLSPAAQLLLSPSKLQKKIDKLVKPNPSKLKATKQLSQQHDLISLSPQNEEQPSQPGQIKYQVIKPHSGHVVPPMDAIPLFSNDMANQNIERKVLLVQQQLDQRLYHQKDASVQFCVDTGDLQMQTLSFSESEQIQLLENQNHILRGELGELKIKNQQFAVQLSNSKAIQESLHCEVQSLIDLPEIAQRADAVFLQNELDQSMFQQNKMQNEILDMSLTQQNQTDREYVQQQEIFNSAHHGLQVQQTDNQLEKTKELQLNKPILPANYTKPLLNQNIVSHVNSQIGQTTNVVKEPINVIQDIGAFQVQYGEENKQILGQITLEDVKYSEDQLKTQQIVVQNVLQQSLKQTQEQQEIQNFQIQSKQQFLIQPEETNTLIQQFNNTLQQQQKVTLPIKDGNVVAKTTEPKVKDVEVHSKIIKLFQERLSVDDELISNFVLLLSEFQMEQLYYLLQNILNKPLIKLTKLMSQQIVKDGCRTVGTQATYVSSKFEVIRDSRTAQKGFISMYKDSQQYKDNIIDDRVSGLIRAVQQTQKQLDVFDVHDMKQQQQQQPEAFVSNQANSDQAISISKSTMMSSIHPNIITTEFVSINKLLEEARQIQNCYLPPLRVITLFSNEQEQKISDEVQQMIKNQQNEHKNGIQMQVQCQQNILPQFWKFPSQTRYFNEVELVLQTDYLDFKISDFLINDIGKVIRQFKYHIVQRINFATNMQEIQILPLLMNYNYNFDSLRRQFKFVSSQQINGHIYENILKQCERDIDYLLDKKLQINQTKIVSAIPHLGDQICLVNVSSISQKYINSVPKVMQKLQLFEKCEYQRDIIHDQHYIQLNTYAELKSKIWLLKIIRLIFHDIQYCQKSFIKVERSLDSSIYITDTQKIQASYNISVNSYKDQKSLDNALFSFVLNRYDQRKLQIQLLLDIVINTIFYMYHDQEVFLFSRFLFSDMFEYAIQDIFQIWLQFRQHFHLDRERENVSLLNATQIVQQSYSNCSVQENQIPQFVRSLFYSWDQGRVDQLSLIVSNIIRSQEVPLYKLFPIVVQSYMTYRSAAMRLVKRVLLTTQKNDFNFYEFRSILNCFNISVSEYSCIGLFLQQQIAGMLDPFYVSKQQLQTDFKINCIQFEKILILNNLVRFLDVNFNTNCLLTTESDKERADLYRSIFPRFIDISQKILQRISTQFPNYSKETKRLDILYDTIYQSISLQDSELTNRLMRKFIDKIFEVIKDCDDSRFLDVIFIDKALATLQAWID